MKRVLSIFLFLLCFIAGYAGTVTFNVDSIATANSWAAKDTISSRPFSISPINFVFAKGTSNSNAYYTPEIRCYYGSTLTISSTYTITNITFTYSVSNSGTLTADVGTLSNKIWTGNATSIVFTTGGGSVKNGVQSNNGQVRYSNIVVTYDDGGSNPTPTVLPVYKDTTVLDNVCDTIDGREAGTYILIKDTTITSTDTTIHYTKQVVEECVAPSACMSSIDFESDSITYSDWVFSSIRSKYKDSGVDTHGGSYYGYTAGKESGYIVTASEITNLQSITFYVSKQTSNDKAAYWKIYISNGSTSSKPTDWTEVKSVSASSMTKGTWVEVTADLSAYASTANKVAIYYTGTSAIRLIDDICLSYKTDPVLVVNPILTINTVNGLMSDEKTGAVNPLFYEGTSTLSATSDNSKFTVTCEDLTYTVKYKASNSCLDTATLTFTYDTLTATIQVYGSNVYKVTNLTETVTDTQVTLKWTKSQSVHSYKVIFNGIEHTVTKGEYIESGLTANTSYSYSITPIVNDLECVETYSGTITTLSCTNYPKDITYSSETNSISLFWTLTDNCNAYLFSNSTCTDTLQHIDNVNNTCIFNNLEENTKYYVIIYGGGTCPSEVIEVSTESPYITIVDWYPDSIHVDLNSADAATVMLEKEVENKSDVHNVADGLFISKYFEASRNVKLIAIYNGTTDYIDLTDLYIIRSTTNGWYKYGTATGNSNNVSLAQYGHNIVGKIAPNEEIIIMCEPTNASGGVSIINCIKESYADEYDDWYKSDAIVFGGDKSIALAKVNKTDSTWILMDVVGAITADGDPTSNGVVSNIPWGDKPGGWYCEDGESMSGETIGLSTNRCLLIRKNTVKSGANSVTSNINNFNTLCTEWVGEHVPQRDENNNDVADSMTCVNFGYVGSFDYDGYYLSYDSVSTTPLNTTHRNADGTYTIPIPDLDTLSCYNIKVVSKDAAGNELAMHTSRVPIMVTTDMNVNNILFTQYTVDTCKICDIVIRDNATLTTVSDPQRPKFRNVYVYSGSTLKVPTNTQHSINSLTLRSEGDEIPYVILNDSLTSYISKVYFTKRITNDRYYFFSLPYDCKISDIYFASGEKPTYGSDWQILYYDGAQRASDNSSASSHWKAMERSATLKAGVGYAIAVNAKQDGYKKEIVFPMTITNANIYATDTVTKSVNITAYGAINGAYPEFSKDGLHANSVGWNFIGNPYLNTFGQLSDSDATIGKVILSADSLWYAGFTDGTNLYYTIPNSGQDQTYYQDFASLYNLKPFQAMFVQAACDGTLTFAQSSVSRKAPRKEEATSTTDIVRINLSNGINSDYTTILIDNVYNEEYEVGADLLKNTTFYTETPQLYSINGDKLAFNALNDSLATNIPLGVYIYKGHTNTFSLSYDFDLSNIEHIYLIDNVAGITTDLLLDDYTFTTSSQLYSNNRFILNIVRKVSKTIATNNNINIIEDGYMSIYDVTGKYIAPYSKLNILPNGIYILSGKETSKKVIICK